MIRNDAWIREQARAGMIVPFEPQQVRITGLRDAHDYSTVVSYGLSSYGYDIRCSKQFRIFTPTWGTVIDPKSFDEKAFVPHEGEFCIIPPNSFVLTSSVERIKVPRDVLVLCIGKSTYARCGVVCGCTPLEPEWEGYVTIELSNTTPLPAKIYAGEGVAQLITKAPVRFVANHLGAPLLEGRLVLALDRPARLDMERCLAARDLRDQIAARRTDPTCSQPTSRTRRCRSSRRTWPSSRSPSPHTSRRRGR